MKTIFLSTIIAIAFSFSGCMNKSNFDLNMTIAPDDHISVTNVNDVKRAADVISKRLEYSFEIPADRIHLDARDSNIDLTITNVDTGKVDLIKKTITGYHKLEFWETYENEQIIGYLRQADNKLKDFKGVAEVSDRAVTNIPQTAPDSVKNESQNPIFGALQPMVTAKGEPMRSCMVGLVNVKDTSLINRYLKMDQVKDLFPGNLKFFWSMNPYKYDASKSLYGLHAIKVTTPDKKAPVDGSVIVSAKPVIGSKDSDVKIDLSMDNAGAKTWAKITRENINQCIAIVYDGHVRSYPRVMGEISGGNTEITGDFTAKEAREIVDVLKSGELPYRLKITDVRILKH